MKIGKLCLAAFLGAMPVPAFAQPSISVNANVEVGDSYDSTAPGDPVESVDVFYDQLSPYGMWVDEPDVGRVFVPDTANFVPYTNGHWQYTSVGFVWTSDAQFGWATSHYGRWAFSNNYGRWYWLPDTQWGPAWVEWRQSGNDFGWAPLAPDVVVRAGWSPPIDSWHYCNHDHILDANVTRYYEPRARVVEIHREARPMEHYATVSNVKVVVGPPASVLRAAHITVRPVRADAHVVGRWTPTEVHAQVARAQEHHATFEVQNQHRIEAHPTIAAAHVKVIEAHPQIKAQVDARVQVGAHPVAPVTAGRPATPVEPTHGIPGHEHGSPTPQPKPAEPAHVQQPPHVVEPAHPQKPAEPAHVQQPPHVVEPAHPQPKPAEPVHVQQPPPHVVEPAHPQPKPAEPVHAAPTPPAHAAPTPPAQHPTTPPATTPAPKKDEHEHH